MQATRAVSGTNRFYRLFLGLLRQYRGSLWLYSAVFFSTITLPTLISFFDETDFFEYAEGMSHLFNGFSLILFIGYMAVIPLSLGIRHFSYMHSKRAVDLFHAIPVTRAELYLAQTAVGALVLAVPVLLNCGLLMLFQIMSGYGHWAAPALGNTLLWLAASYAVFAITGFCAVNVGSAGDTALFSMALNGAPAAIYMLSQAVNSVLLYGFSFDDRNVLWAVRLSPIATMVWHEVNAGYGWSGDAPEMLWAMPVWVLLALGLTVASVLLYKRRRSVIAEVVGNLGPMQLAVRAMVYYLGSVVFALAFEGIFGSSYDRISHVYFCVGAGVGALVTGIVGEMLLTRSPGSTFKRLPIILGVTVLTVGASAAYASGGFGFESYVPAAEQVASVRLDFGDGYDYFNGFRTYEYSADSEHDDPGVIARAVAAHQAVVDDYLQNSEENAGGYYGSSYFIRYTLKNGQEVSRRYYTESERAAAELVRLSMEPGYVRARSEFFAISPGEIASVTLRSVLQDSEAILAPTAEQNTALLEAIRADLTARDADALMAGADALGLIELSVLYREKGPYGDMNDDLISETLYFTVYESDAETIAFLEQNELMYALEADFGRVTGLWIVDADYGYRYYYGNPIAILNVSTGEEVSYAVNEAVRLQAAREQGEEIYDYDERQSDLFAVDPARAAELAALATATARVREEVLIVAFRTDSSMVRTGYLYIRWDDIPADLQRALSEYGRAYGSFRGFSEGGEAPLQPEEPFYGDEAPAAAVEEHVTPVSLRVVY